MRRRLATLCTAALAAATTALVSPGGGARAEEPAPPLSLKAPTRIVAESWDGWVWTDLGARLVANGAPFEVWSTRASYDDPVVSVWKSAGGDVTLPEGTLASWHGLDGFLRQRVVRVRDGRVMSNRLIDQCLNGFTQRVRPEAPASSPYPYDCPHNPYTLGSVMGIQAGWASVAGDPWGAELRLAPGRYDVTTRITAGYLEMFGLDPAQSVVSSRLRVIEGDGGFGGLSAARRAALRAAGTGASGTGSTDERSPVPLRPAATEPTSPAAGSAAVDNLPDLKSLPAFGIDLNRRGTLLRFGANVWNGGHGPLVVDGFREDTGEDSMTAYQYYFDTDGNQTGYDQVGELHFHRENHQHWHFDDFARYRLLNADMTQAVRSTKQSFCLANTDAVDYTIPGADWRPESTDLSTACGGPNALSIREVLSNGSGDTYAQYRAGQAFRVGNLPNGIYYVEVQANPLGNLNEVSEDNNVSYRKIRLRGPADARRVQVFGVGVVDENAWG